MVVSFIVRLVRLWGLYAKMDLAWLLRDRTTAILALLADITTSLSGVGGIFLLAWRFDGIGGMGRYEVLFMLAYATLIAGVFNMFCAGNNGHVSRKIGRGQFEHMFIQPMSLPLQLASEGFNPFTGGSGLVSGAALMVIAVSGLEAALPWWWVLSLIFNLFTTLAIILGLMYLASSLTFYAPVQAEEITSFIYDGLGHIGNFPLSGMPVYLQITLITAFPAGLMAWFPTMVMLGRAPAWYPPLFAIVLWIIAVYFFKKGMKYYVERGINRYVNWGHRS